MAYSVYTMAYSVYTMAYSGADSQAQIRRMLLISLAVYFVLVWIPSAYTYYGGGVSNQESAAGTNSQKKSVLL